MKKEKKEKLEAKGWKVTSVAEFLELTPDEEKIIELRLALSRAVKTRRLESNMTQEIFARKIKSSQSRVAKMEAGDRSVSIDLLIETLFKTGIDRRRLSEFIAA